MKKNCGARPFDCGDSEFLQCVLETHEILVTDYNTKVKGFMGDLVHATFPVELSTLNIPEGENCDDYLWEVSYNPARKANDDIMHQWVPWPVSDPTPISGCVHFSVPLINALKIKLGVSKLELTKALEQGAGSDIVAIAIKGYTANGSLAYIGNLTSQHPLDPNYPTLP